MKIKDYFRRNYTKEVKLYKLGLGKDKLIRYYKYCEEFDQLKTSIPRMQRYSIVAENNKVSEKTVRLAVRVMNSSI